jgi:small subunit ribosomal protein S21
MVYLLPWQPVTQPELAPHTDAVYHPKKGRQPLSAHDEVRTRLPNTTVTQILIRDGESFEGAIKRFTRKVQQAGVLSEAKRRRHYEPPSVKRKRKAETRARKVRKAMAKAAARGL